MKIERETSCRVKFEKKARLARSRITRNDSAALAFLTADQLIFQFQVGASWPPLDKTVEPKKTALDDSVTSFGAARWTGA